jgi:hypothetical protein
VGESRQPPLGEHPGSKCFRYRGGENMNACASETKVEAHVAKKGPRTRTRAFSFYAFMATVLLAWFAMRPWHGGTAAFAGSARCRELGSSVAQEAGSEVDSGIGLSGGGAWPFAASDSGAGLLATGSRSEFLPSFAGDKGAPLGAGCYFSGAFFYFCAGTARPP